MVAPPARRRPERGFGGGSSPSGTGKWPPPGAAICRLRDGGSDGGSAWRAAAPPAANSMAGWRKGASGRQGARRPTPTTRTTLDGGDPGSAGAWMNRLSAQGVGGTPATTTRSTGPLTAEVKDAIRCERRRVAPRQGVPQRLAGRYYLKSSATSGLAGGKASSPPLLQLLLLKRLPSAGEDSGAPGGKSPGRTVGARWKNVDITGTSPCRSTSIPRRRRVCWPDLASRRCRKSFDS